MYAVIKSGGKQHVVREGDVVRLEKLPQDVGEEIEFTEVLLIKNGEEVTVGTPVVEGAVVKAKVVSQGRGDKIVIFKKKRRKRFKRTQGHRQFITAVSVTGITVN